MSNISYPKYKLSQDITINSITASSGFTGSFFGDGSGLTNLPPDAYTTQVTGNITGSGIISDKIRLKDDISLNSITASVGITSSFYGDGSGLYNIPSGAVDLSNYATLTGVSGTFISGTELNIILNDYATLVGVSSSFTTPSQVSGAITGALTNYITGVISSGNLTGSGITGDELKLKDNIELFSVTASVGLVSNGTLTNGLETVTSGEYTHAGGIRVIASGFGSHAEGYESKAYGLTSHAEGFDNKTYGEDSHAEGKQNIAYGNHSHVEGFSTITYGTGSHAEGINTIAYGDYSHTEGSATQASGNYSHAEGFMSIASGESSHAEGESSIAAGDYSHAEGYQSHANGKYSHAEGTSYAENDYSHAEGLGTIALGYGSHTEGIGTIASGSSQHVQGKFNLPNTESLAIIGNGESDSNRSNILEVYNDNIVISGSLISTGGYTGSLPGILTNNIIYVSQDGDDINNGSFNKPLKTLQAANDLASSSYNDFSNSVIIKVLPGIYSGFNLTRYNTYVVSDNTNLRQRAVTINGPIRIQVSGTQKYNQVCGFDGFLFNTGSGIEPIVHVQGTGSSGLYIQNCQFYSNTTNANANLLRIDGAYNEEKVVLRGCNFLANQPGADLIKIIGGDVELDSCTMYVSGSGASCTISASGDVYVTTDRTLIENYSTSPAIAFNSVRSLVISNSSITKGGAAKAIQGSSTSGMIIVNSYFGSYIVVPNYANITNNLNISGSAIYYANLTSLVPSTQVTVTGGTALSETHGQISSSAGITGSFNGDGSLITNLTASNITNFSSSVRDVLLPGDNIVINQVGSKYAISASSSISASSLTVDYIDFNTASVAPSFNTGRIHYDQTTGDLQYDTTVNGIVLNVGQQLIQRCLNQTSASIGKGKVVHITGSNGSDTPRIALADWSNDNLSANTLGITMNSSNHGDFVFVVEQGILTGVDLSYLSGRSDGQLLYLSSSGQITNVKPTAPKHTVSLGQIVAKATVGTGQNTTIYTSINNGYELSELHDVSTNGKSNGDLLSWNSGSSVWTNTKHLSGSYDITGSLTITELLQVTPQTKLTNSLGSAGQICWDSNYIYVCTATDTWKSSSLL